MPDSNEPIIVLGAARSGTKMLRDTLAAASDLGVVEYDVNYIWRAGNEHYPHDTLPADLAIPRVLRFVRKQLSRVAVGVPPSGRFVEKTVGNVLRVPFVHRIYPNAKYVFLIRDGRDVAESAMRCWQTPPDVGYLMAKLKTFPWLMGARYGVSYARRVLSRKLGLTPYLSSWGPRYNHIDDDVRQYPLLQVCARQWIACVEAYEQAKQLFKPNQIVEVRYEDVVANPCQMMKQLCDQLEVTDHGAVVDRANRSIVKRNVGKRSRLQQEQLAMISELQGGVLERWGYKSNPTSRSAA
jgi:hypothetical protein